MFAASAANLSLVRGPPRSWASRRDWRRIHGVLCNSRSTTVSGNQSLSWNSSVGSLSALPMPMVYQDMNHSPARQSRPPPVIRSGKDVWKRGAKETTENDTGVSPKKGYTGGRRTLTRVEPKEAVAFKGSFPEDARVAILGGGMSGLMCALTLAEQGVRCTVFDTGRHGMGGRMGTREIPLFGASGSNTESESVGVPGESVGIPRESVGVQGDTIGVFDHAAQYFTVSDERFAEHVLTWLQKGLVREWDGCIGTLEAGGLFSVHREEASEGSSRKGEEEGAGVEKGIKYIGSDGMRHLCDRLGEEASRTGLVDLQRPAWITKMEYTADGTHHAGRESWRLTDEHRRQRGEYDFVVIAHNGKCANRLLEPAGVPLVAAQMKRLKLSSIWCSMIAFAGPMPVPTDDLSGRKMEGAFVSGVPAVSWMCNNNAKLNIGGASTECWTLFSTSAYGKQNKVPQERIPAHVAEKVKSDMLQGMALALGTPHASLPRVVHHKVQLWGAALPLNAPGSEFICDASCRVAICGDWLLSPSVEAAAISGISLANHIARLSKERATANEMHSLGLHAPLTSTSGAHDIGAFP